MTRPWMQPLFHKVGGGAAPPGLQGFTQQGAWGPGVPYPTPWVVALSPGPASTLSARGAGTVMGAALTGPATCWAEEARPWAWSRGRQGAVLPAHTAPPRPLHTPGVTVDLDDLPGLVGSLVVHTRAVLLGHAASAPVGQQPHRADTARHAVSAELWTGGCRQQSLWPGSGCRPPGPPGSTATPFRPTHTVHVQAMAASHALGSRCIRGGVAAVKEHHRGHAPCRDSHAGRASRAAAALPLVMGGDGAPRAEVQGGPHLCSAPWPPDSSASHSHTSYERRGWGQSGPLPHCPHPDPRRDPGLVVSQGQAPSAGLR